MFGHFIQMVFHYISIISKYAADPSPTWKVQKNIDDVVERGTKKVESFRHSWNILQWNKNDFKSRISTNGDYFLTYVCFSLLKLWSFSLNSFLSFSCFIQDAVKRSVCCYHNTAKEKYHSAMISMRVVPSENSFITLKALLTLST